MPTYSLEDSLETKIEKIARNIYGAAGVNFSDKARGKLQLFKDWCFSRLPVCIAKTQYSFSDNPKLLGAPSGWTLNVTDASLSAGAGFVVVIAGNMMLMPGLPKVSRAASINVDARGEITGIEPCGYRSTVPENSGTQMLPRAYWNAGRIMAAFLLWCILLVLCWPLALLALLLYPLVWLLLLPFRIVGIAMDGILELVKAIITLPARLLAGGKPRLRSLT